MSMITIRVAFDGGYLYDFGGSKEQLVYVDQASIGHPMLYEIQGAGQQPARLEGVVALYPDNSVPKPAMPLIPPRGKEGGCDPSDDANQRRFIPDLDWVAGQLGGRLKTRDERQPVATVKLTGGGELKIEDLSGCVEFRQNGQSIPGTRSLPSGIGGIVYEWSVDAQMVALVRETPKGPEPIAEGRPDQYGRNLIRISTFEDTPTPNLKPHAIDHFIQHFGGVFEDVSRSPVSLWWLGSYSLDGARRNKFGDSRSPGIDCPPGSTA